MSYHKYLIRPMAHGLDMADPSLHQSLDHADWPAKNFKIGQRSVKKRCGYGEDRDLGEGVDVQQIVYYKKSDGTNCTLYFTPNDVMKRESSGTWSYITVKHTEQTVSGISGATVTGSSTDWVDATDATAPAVGVRKVVADFSDIESEIRSDEY